VTGGWGWGWGWGWGCSPFDLITSFDFVILYDKFLSGHNYTICSNSDLVCVGTSFAQVWVSESIASRVASAVSVVLYNVA